MWMFWITFLLIEGSTFLEAQDVNPCDSMPTGISGPALPDLPSQYQATIEANIIQKNQQILVKESYDFERKMAAIHMTSYGITTGNIINFYTGERYSFAPNGSCQTYNLTDKSPNNIFGFLVKSNGSVHFATSADVFRFGRTYNETYVGKEQIRGIPVDHWVSCQRSDELHSTFRLDYYFSRDNFLSPTNKTKIPVRISILGVAMNEDPQGNVKPTGSHNFSHVYEYSYFEPGPIKDQSVFQTPQGVVCKGRRNARPLPTIPEQFTMNMETVSPRFSRNYKLYFDYTFKLLRTDTYQPIGSKYGGGLISIISDYQSGVEYVINQYEGNCTVRPITDVSNRFQPYDFSEADHQMKRAFEVLNVKNKTYVYQGKRLLRGLLVDTWGNITDDGSVQEMYFLPPKQNGGFSPQGRQKRQTPISGRHQGSHDGQHSGQHSSPRPSTGQMSPPPPVPMNQLVGIFRKNGTFKPNQTQQYEQMGGLQWSNGAAVLNIYNFVTTHPDFSVFDITACYPSAPQEIFLQFSITGNYKMDVSGRKDEFYTGVRNVIAKTAGISLLRIGSLEITQSHTDKNKMLVTFSLLDKLPSSVSVKEGYKEKSLNDAYNSLMTAMNSKSLAFTVRPTQTAARMYYVQKKSLTKSVLPDKSTGQYSAGSMAGLGFGMIILGCILGLLIAFVIYRRVSPPLSVPYERST